MADPKPTPTPAPAAGSATLGFDFSMRITPANYATLEKERDEINARQLEAPNEFMFQHYNRLLREINESLLKASGVKVALDKKAQRVEAQKRRAEIQSAREAARMQRYQERMEAQRAKFGTR